ncbi:hypothetical protein FISHEDRAFT_40695 [Fistulina hepatica ATCC 64428]|uniref:Uncharacterized protein n=1 Tax=Fistulina hepatica ATCC 64428 TaxID=1128425 RepID=A0A0D7AEI2_9AGAR|nr:hypothetical protein FISHEDRAFT_40695 [Fistulina hepatica ATCC 64428]
MASPHQSAAVVDDLPWPELGNVSRGATRGNQGQKGVLGPSDVEGRCVLQLRVQPGVLSVKLNRQASLWYRTLDNEVNRALKLTKSYWRKARRRQDYDARADQDHMELHEWLQQLKDKTMSHLELLMQKGDITGPPYIMGDDLELTFLRKFMERQTRGVPHNPRLRNPIFNAENQMSRQSIESTSPDSTDAVMSQSIIGACWLYLPTSVGGCRSNVYTYIAQRNSISPTLNNTQLVSQEASTSKHELLAARSALQRAQQETHEAFLRYTACLEAEQQARQTVAAAEKRRDDLVALLISKNHVSMAGMCLSSCLR